MNVRCCFRLDGLYRPTAPVTLSGLPRNVSSAMRTIDGHVTPDTEKNGPTLIARCLRSILMDDLRVTGLRAGPFFIHRTTRLGGASRLLPQRTKRRKPKNCTGVGASRFSPHRAFHDPTP